MTTRFDDWKKFLDPAELKSNLTMMSLFITVFEIFKAGLIDKPKILYSDGFDSKGNTTLSPKYNQLVKSKSSKITEASLLWFYDQGAIEQSDITKYQRILKHRNDVTHESIKYFTSTKFKINEDIFCELIDLFVKIEKWWIINFECALDEHIDFTNVDYENVASGTMITVQTMIEIALEVEPEKGFYLNHLLNIAS